ncbi:signal peptidase II [bacterium]|nr:signal peptidase II [bacterium]
MEISTTQKEETQEQEKLPVKANFLRDYLPLLFGTGLIIALDQFTKSLVVEHIPFLNSWLPESLSWLAPYARIVHWRNSGAAFGIFQNGNIIFMIMAVLATIFILVYYPIIGKEEKAIRFAMILQLGGALGNLIDRVKFGFVIDFLSVGNFPVFNVADASITIGVAVLLLSILIQEYKEQRAAKLNIEPSVPDSDQQIEDS